MANGSPTYQVDEGSRGHDVYLREVHFDDTKDFQDGSTSMFVEVEICEWVEIERNTFAENCKGLEDCTTSTTGMTFKEAIQTLQACLTHIILRYLCIEI